MATDVSRVDLHCHSTASQISRLGIQRALGLPECATTPEEVHALAKRRGMDFVTITDHDTIDGVLQIADRDDVFISVELTARFLGEPQAVHVLCWGIAPGDHEWLQSHSEDLERCAEYLHEQRIACALAHPFYAVEAPLGVRHRRRLAELFPIWEVRNGARAAELNQPAAIYVETHGGVGVGGSDDHAGVDIGRTFTQAPAARTPAQFLAHVRAGDVEAGGQHGSAAKWAHTAMALAIRAVGSGDGERADPRAVLRIIERLMREGELRQGRDGNDLSPDHARDLLRAWLDAIGWTSDPHELLVALQQDGFSHTQLLRRAQRAHERKLHAAVERIQSLATRGEDYGGAAACLFDACVPAIPYVPAVAFLAREKARLASRDGDPARVAIVADAIGAMHGVRHTLDEIRARGVPGFEAEVMGTDCNVDRRLPAAAETEVPFYEGLEIGVPTVPAIVQALADGRYDLVHVCGPGPAGVAAVLAARVMGLPTVGSYHTELATYAGVRSGSAMIEATVRLALGAFYGGCDLVLSPSSAADDSVRALGVPDERILRWDRGVDLLSFGPERRVPGLFGDAINVLYAGRLTKEKGVGLLADALVAACDRDPRIHAILAGGGPEEAWLRERLGERATFLGWLDQEELARAYASADMFLFASRTDTFGQVILEAQASGLPVVAVGQGGSLDLISEGVTGLLRPAEADALASALVMLAAHPQARRRLAGAALEAVRARTWEGALAQLAGGYRRALAGAGMTLRQAA